MTGRENMMVTLAWPLVLAAAAIGGTLATACMMPFVAVATLAAATMPRVQALITILGVWAANQLLGFGLLGYPLDAYAVSWGMALGGSSVAAMFVARRFVGRGVGAALIPAFAAAFLAFEMLLLGFALVVGGVETFAPSIVLRLLANDALWLAGLALLHAALTRAAPRVFVPQRT